ncbi:MAG: hypothetical protein WCK16_01510 [Candidatus Moraniibacteriota bacterium]
MATIIFSQYDDGSGYAVVRIAKGENFFANFMIPEGIDAFAEIERTEKGSVKLTAKMYTIAVVEGLHQSGRGCKHVRFIRAGRSDADGLSFVQPKAWPRLRVALGHANVPTVHVQGGFESAIAYSDEIAVPNYSMSGSSGWIIRRKDIGKFLDALPALRDSGEIKTVWINHVGWMNTPDECAICVVDHDPSNEEPPSYYDRPRGYSMSSNHQIFRVEFDKGSRLVKRIVDQSSGEECGAVGYRVHPVARYIEVGKRMPAVDK